MALITSWDYNALSVFIDIDNKSIAILKEYTPLIWKWNNVSVDYLNEKWGRVDCVKNYEDCERKI